MNAEILEINQHAKGLEVIFDYIGKRRTTIVTQKVMDYLTAKTPDIPLKVRGVIIVHRTIKPSYKDPAKLIELFRISKILR